ALRRGRCAADRRQGRWFPLGRRSHRRRRRLRRCGRPRRTHRIEEDEMRRLLPAVVGASACFAAAAALGAPPQDLIKSYYLGPSGRAAPLNGGQAFQASEFPVPIRITPPEPGWSGVQWKSGREYFRGGAPPNYGWVHLLRGDPTGIPRGLISIMTAYTTTPSVDAVVNVL